MDANTCKASAPASEIQASLDKQAALDDIAILDPHECDTCINAAHARHVREVLRNLLKHAVKFMSPQPVPRMVIGVRDTENPPGVCVAGGEHQPC